jgi:hypothetical protein
MSASDLADEYDAVMADVIAVAGGCSQADWTTSCINEQRSIGVVFDHIAELNPVFGAAAPGAGFSQRQAGRPGAAGAASQAAAQLRVFHAMGEGVDQAARLESLPTLMRLL